MKKLADVTCYMCSRPATSMEHIPPKCIFPEIKDTDGVDYRKNLIKVPSCDEHNSNTSKDDELFMIVVTAYFQSAGVADLHFNTKVKRALDHSPKFRHHLVCTAQPLFLDGKFTYALQPDPRRIQKQLEKIGYGLYFEHFKQKWAKPVLVDTPARTHLQGITANKDNLFWQKLSNLVLVHFDDAPIYGENPEVFFYQMRVLPGTQFVIARVVIFNGFVINIAYDMSDPDLGT